jgi:hypothetical protein
LTGPLGAFVSGLAELAALAIAAGVELRPGNAGGESERGTEEEVDGVGDTAGVAALLDDVADEDGVLVAGAVDGGPVG